MTTRSLSVILAVIFLLTAVVPAFSETEDEVIAKYLKKNVEKKIEAKKGHVGFFTVNFNYGKLPNQSSYNKFTNYANSNIALADQSSERLTGIYRSKQIGANLGMMVSPRAALKLGFEYWLKMGTDATGNYDFNIEPLGDQTDFNLRSQVQVYGVTAGVDYYLLNAPDNKGLFKSLAVRVGAGGGFYMSKWQIWKGNTSFNLATETFDPNNGEYKSSAPGFNVSLGLDYPIRFFGMTMSADAGFLFLNFSNVHGYNDLGEELYLTYSANTNDRVDLDFSGLRGKIELKKFFSW
jgi:hypothetical protein